MVLFMTSFCSPRIGVKKEDEVAAAGADSAVAEEMMEDFTSEPVPASSTAMDEDQNEEEDNEEA